MAGWLRGSHFHATAGGVGWFIGGVLTFTVFMYSVAEVMANRIPIQEEYVGLTPVVAILPWFLAGSLFPITALPGWLAWAARILPTTHALALLRYGVLDQTRCRAAQHLGVHQHYHRRRPQPSGPGRLGDCRHRRRHPCLHPLGGDVMAIGRYARHSQIFVITAAAGTGPAAPRKRRLRRGQA